jgi:hypothetical protein
MKKYVECDFLNCALHYILFGGHNEHRSFSIMNVLENIQDDRGM